MGGDGKGTDVDAENQWGVKEGQRKVKFEKGDVKCEYRATERYRFFQ